MKKLIPLLVLACSIIVRENTFVFGADQMHPRNPKLESALFEQPRLSAPVSEPSSGRALAPASEEKKRIQKEELCAKEPSSTADCPPQPGSSLSAFPLVSYPSSPAKENLP